MHIHEINWEEADGLAHRCGSCLGALKRTPTRLRAWEITPAGV